MARRTSDTTIALPKPETLDHVRLDDGGANQPAWIADQHPDHVAGHGAHQLTSLRTAEHAGHTIEIATTYEIRIDGQPVHLHASVSNDGRVMCHSTPYVAYRSTVDLVKSLLDRYGDALPTNHHPGPHHEPTGHHGHGGHDGHDSHGGAE